MENIPRVHNIWPPQTDSKKLRKIDSVNQSSSMAGSSSCQCTATLHGKQKEMQRHVKIILVQLRMMLADFLAVIGHSWDPDQKRNDTELSLRSLMGSGIKQLKT